MIDQTMRLTDSAIDFEGKDGTASLWEIALVQSMIRMSGQRRMIHPFYFRVLNEVADDLPGIFGMPLHTQGKRFQSLQQQEGVKRTDSRSCIPQQYRPDSGQIGGRSGSFRETKSVISRVRLRQLREFSRTGPVEFPGINDDATQGSSVYANELRSRMHDDIGSVFNRADQERCAERVIDNQGNSMLMGNAGHRLQINQIGIRVTQCFNKDGFRMLLYGLFEVPWLGRIHKCCMNSIVGKRMFQQVVCTAIKRPGSHQMITTAGNVQKGISNGGGTRSHGQSGYAAFQCSHTLFEDILRRVSQPAINGSGITEVKAGRGLG